MAANGHPQASRLRKGRCSIAGQVYLLTSTTCRRRPVFADQALGLVVMEAIRHHGVCGQTTNLAYVVANPLRAGLVRRLVDYPLWGSQYPDEFVGMCL
jgi:hypothetical protein